MLKPRCRERIRQKETFGKEEIMFGGVHCTRLIIFLKLKPDERFSLYSTVVEIINLGLSIKEKKHTGRGTILITPTSSYNLRFYS